MPLRLYVTNQRQTAARRIVLCRGCVGPIFIAIIAVTLLQTTEAAENMLPDPQGSVAPTKIQAVGPAREGKLALRVVHCSAESRKPN